MGRAEGERPCFPADVDDFEVVAAAFFLEAEEDTALGDRVVDFAASNKNLQPLKAVCCRVDIATDFTCPF